MTRRVLSDEEIVFIGGDHCSGCEDNHCPIHETLNGDGNLPCLRDFARRIEAMVIERLAALAREHKNLMSPETQAKAIQNATAEHIAVRIERLGMAGDPGDMPSRLDRRGQACRQPSEVAEEERDSHRHGGGVCHSPGCADDAQEERD